MAAKWQKTLDDLLYNGDLDGAYNLLDGILRENSGDLQARLAFGKVQYELGDPDNARNTFDIRFYLVAILFILFDLEATFLFPWAVTLSNLTNLGFWSMFDFIFELVIGFIYAWKIGSLEWE